MTRPKISNTRRPNVHGAIVELPISSLKLNSKNPRLHSRRQLKVLAANIEKVGFISPVLIDHNRNVLAGQARIMAVQSLGWTEVPTIAVNHLTEAEARAHMLADNRIAELADWDEALLGEAFNELYALHEELDLEVHTGFSMPEIDRAIDALISGTTKPANDPADEVPEAQDQIVSRLGDVWQLGRHRVICGNSLESGTYDTLMEGEKAAMVFTDPPWNLAVRDISGLGAIKHREFAMASGEMTASEFTSFLSTSLQNLLTYSDDGSIHYICMDWRHIPELLSAGSAYTELKNIITWVKDNAGMGSLYRSQHEFIFVYKNGKAPHRNNIELGRFGRYRTNVWQYPGANSFSRSGEEGNLLALHPTVKPVAMVAEAIKDCSGRDEIILDPFLGSGTTIIAAERTGRRAYGIEIDPGYVDTIIRRWQRLTDNEAVHLTSGNTFNKTAATNEKTDD